MNSVQLAQKLWEQFLQRGYYDTPKLEDYVVKNGISRVEKRIALWRSYIMSGMVHKSKMLEVVPFKEGPI